MKHILTNYKTLPFAERWLEKYKSTIDPKNVLSKLLVSKYLMAYPVYLEASRNLVAQSEHTVYIDTNEVVVLT